MSTSGPTWEVWDEIAATADRAPHGEVPEGRDLDASLESFRHLASNVKHLTIYDIDSEFKDTVCLEVLLNMRIKFPSIFGLSDNIEIDDYGDEHDDNER